MLFIEHSAPHLYREDAYREYCYSVDAYSSYQPASFIYLCFESFKECCSNYGLRILHTIKSPTSDRLSEYPHRYEKDFQIQPNKFYGYITRILEAQDVKNITNALTEGKNVIALFPNELISLWFSGKERKKEMREKAIKASQKTGS